MSDILDFYSTNSLAWEQLEYGAYGLKNLHYGLIHNGLSTCVDTKDAILPVIKQNCMPKNYTECQNGDVAFADASEDTNDVAKCVEFIDCHADKVVCGLHTIHGRDKGDKTVVGFKGYAFSSQAFRHQIRRLAQGTKIYSISSKNFSECNIGIPSKEEQTKIATLLKLIEQRILTQKKIIEDLKKLKDAINNSLHNNIKDYQIFSFNELGNNYSGLTGKSSEDFGSGLPYISYLNVFRNDIVTDESFDYVKVSKTEKQNVVSYGDLLFTLSSETPSEVGIGAIYLGKTNPIYLNSFCFGVHLSNQENIYGSYRGH